MLNLQLNDQETEMLHKILDSYLSDLRVEIADTDLVDFRDVLKTEETFIKDVLHRLESKHIELAL